MNPIFSAAAVSRKERRLYMPLAFNSTELVNENRKEREGYICLLLSKFEDETQTNSAEFQWHQRLSLSAASIPSAQRHDQPLSLYHTLALSNHIFNSCTLGNLRILFSFYNVSVLSIYFQFKMNGVVMVVFLIFLTLVS
ncbi:hypothetical protein NE237_027679 [Protea cynaroides]|uniref:Uncharacterized protein n=1 Tax=Protea cynaroides TaxID=273540 RepID=A0A9Q0GRU5_9MAGN|nr:hypothetical protein NE237_027679 [Protea cynaroides]